MPAPTVLESERYALGSALKGNAEAAEILTSELQPEDFYSANNRKIFLAIKGLTDEALSVNTVSVIERSGISQQEIDELADRARDVTVPQLKTFVSDISRTSKLRVVYNSCNDTRDLITKDAKVEEVLEKLEKSLYKTDRNGGTEAQDGYDVMQRVVKDFLARHKDGGGPEISTGMRALDRAIIGLRPGKMVVIAARPSMGKTALADTIRRSVVQQGYGAIQFSLEMSAEEILERELACQASLNLRKVLAAKEVTDDELQRVIEVGGNGHHVQGRWAIDDRTYSISGIRRRARICAGRMARAGIKVGVVILDYIQLAGDNGDGREQSVAAISRGCKLMAKELGCTVLALSQLNRACEARDDRRPLMSDLRESGAIEQDADIVGFVYREHMYSNAVPPDDTEFIIRKQRSGPTGTVRLHYDAKLVAFKDLPQERPN